MNSMRKKIPFVFEAFLIILTAILAGTLLMWLAYLLPTSQMERNMPATAEIFQKEGTDPNIPFWAFSALNNFTDGMAFSEAVYDAPLGALHESMAVSRNLYGYASADQSIVNHYINGFDGHWSECYSRYWHGYLVFLKPLLMVTGFGGIRIINAAAQLLLLIAAVILLFRNGYKQYIIPFLLSVFCLRLVATALCITYSHVYYVSLAGCISVICFNAKGLPERSYLRLFLLLGILTAYLDMLTYPIVAFFLPATMMLNIRDRIDFRSFISLFLKIGFCWLAGYLLMWSGKWVIGSIITGDNYIHDGIAQIIEDTGNDIDFSYFEVVYATVRDFALTPAMILVVAYAVFLLITIFKNKLLALQEKHYYIPVIIEYLLIAGFPFFYFMVMLRHTGIHHGLFVNKVLVVTTFALLSMFVKLISECRHREG